MTERTLEEINQNIEKIHSGFKAVLAEHGVDSDVIFFLLGEKGNPNDEVLVKKIEAAMDGHDKDVSVRHCRLCCDTVYCKECCIAIA